MSPLRVLTVCLSLVLPSLSGSVRAADAQSRESRLAAASAAAHGAAECRAAQPFWWEIGDAHGRLAGEAVGPGAPDGGSRMPIASASKWIYAAYVAERRNGRLSEEDVNFLTFRSGQTHFRNCRRTQTVSACLDSLLNGRGRLDDQAVGKFSYGGGHMQKHASLLGLGDDDAAALGAEIRRGLAALGSDWRFEYSQAQPAGGGVTSADDYARFLRGLLDGSLRLGGLLGSHAVCTNPASCPGQAVRTPIPQQESWHYAIGHWVEDDPRTGDGAFSSPGAFGFYPWIDAGRHYYGILARQSRSGLLAGDEEERPGVQSVMCGRLIRAAWEAGRVTAAGPP